MTPDPAKLAALGVRFRTAYLIQQAGYTLGLATAEGPALAALLPAGHLGKTAQLRDDVTKAVQDKTVRASEAKQATNTQNEQMGAATVWVRKVGRRLPERDSSGHRPPARADPRGPTDHRARMDKEMLNGVERRNPAGARQYRMRFRAILKKEGKESTADYAREVMTAT